MENKFCFFNRKAQSATEFMILVGAMLFFFVGFLSVLYFNMNQKSEEKLNIDLEQAALAVQDEINLASGASEGYSRTFTVPQKVSGIDFEMKIIGNSLYIKAGDKFAASYPIPKVETPSSPPGESYIIPHGKNILTKLDGKVYINQ
jgi:hypothetical protein